MNRTHHSTRRALAAIALSLGTLAGCSDSSETAELDNNNETTTPEVQSRPLIWGEGTWGEEEWNNQP